MGVFLYTIYIKVKMANKKKIIIMSDKLTNSIDLMKIKYDKPSFTETVRWLVSEAIIIKEKEAKEREDMLMNYFASLGE